MSGGGTPKRPGYLGAIAEAARTTAEGMAVTLAQLMRRPTTVQYPDRTPAPVVDSLPERYRGLLEVDLEVCTACKACERDCPIDVIAIEVEKRDEGRGMTRFDIDMAKCMYCGICVEVCPVPAQAPGDAEPTRSIRMTREFEGATGELESLTFRFIKPGGFVPPFRPTKGAVPPTRARGELAREARRAGREENPPTFRWALGEMRKQEAERLIAPAALTRRAGELAFKAGSARGDALVDLLVREALVQTDCEQCGHETCAAYARALVEGADRDPARCAPGGPAATRDVALVLALGRGQGPEAAGEAAALAVRQAHAPAR